MKKRLATAILCMLLLSLTPAHIVMASGYCDSHSWGYRSYTESEQVLDYYVTQLAHVYDTNGKIITVPKLVPVYRTIYYIVHEMYCTKCGYVGDSGRNRM